MLLSRRHLFARKCGISCDLVPSLFKLTQRQKTLYFSVVLVLLKLNLLNSLFLIVIKFDVFDQLRRIKLHTFVLLVKIHAELSAQA